MLNRLQDVFSSFEKHKVRYLVIGGIAAILYGVPRATIDVQTFTPGLSFQDAWKNREIMDYQGQRFYVVSKADLVASKKAAGRDVDLEDVRLLTLEDSEHQG
jgi:hypothetical protein